jgi:hypothetical protein
MKQLKKKRMGVMQIAEIEVNDPRLSWEEKGLLAYIDGMGKDSITAAKLAKASSNSNRSTLAIIRKLENHGYLTSGKEMLTPEEIIEFEVNRLYDLAMAERARQIRAKKKSLKK